MSTTGAPALLRTVGILGDIHAEDDRLVAALALFHARDVDAILSVGDIVDGPGDINRTCDLLRSANVEAVRGNHDRWIGEGTLRDLPLAHSVAKLSDASRSYLAALPPTRTFETIKGRLLLCHGLLENDMRQLRPTDFGYELQCNYELQELLARKDLTFVAGGHTHRRMVRRFGHLTVLNAGTLTNRGGDAQPCALLVDFVKGVAEFHDMADPAVSHPNAPEIVPLVALGAPPGRP